MKSTAYYFSLECVSVLYISHSSRGKESATSMFREAVVGRSVYRTDSIQDGGPSCIREMARGRASEAERRIDDDDYDARGTSFPLLTF